MHDIYHFFKEKILSITSALYENGKINCKISYDEINVELIKDVKFGDYTTNLAMLACKKLSMQPKQIATLIAEGLNLCDFVESASVAGAGFVNWSVKVELFHDFLKEILLSGDNFGSSNIGSGKSVNVEYVSANPTGPIHAGHARGAVVGDALASILKKVGYKVTKEYYINDYGNQIDILANSLYARYLEVLGEQKFETKPGYYPGEYLIDLAQKIAKTDGKKWVGSSDYLDNFKKFAISNLIELIKDDLAALGVCHDVFTSESSLVKSNAVDRGIEILRKEGLVYRGILEQPKSGKVIEDWEPREQLLFKSTTFGDDVDRPLIKSDGAWTYFASDIAYHLDKIERGSTSLVDIFGADHGGYVKRMKAAIYALNKDIKFDILLTQLVKFVQNGEELKMSKRAGTFVTAKDIVDAVGKDVVRFIMLTRKSDVGLDFDFKKVTEQSMENPIFYVQYASARANSVLRQFALYFGPFEKFNTEDVDFSHISAFEEKSVIKILLDFPRQILLAASLMEPHRVSFYLQDLAASFHSLWNVGKGNKKLRFISEDTVDVSLAKCSLVRCVSIVISAGLGVLGIEAVKEL